jgi:oxygen-dependent protoporphyrinogen oxidase
MRGRLLFIAGAALGYVLGSRAGRARYEQIKTVSGKIWNSDGVQKGVHGVEDFVADRTPDVAEFIGETTKKVVRKAASKGSSDTSGTSSAGQESAGS